jgi:uncharacterized RDD family membrane protein YckC
MLNTSKPDSSADTIFPRRLIEYANAWERFGAFVIDFLIVILIGLLLHKYLPMPYGLIAVGWIYEAWQISSPSQATIGQKTMGIKVSNQYGGRLDFPQASLRYFCKYISFFTALSGYLIVILDKRKQCFHDKVAESFVVTEESYQAAI